MRGITKERDKEIQGKINRRRRWLSLVWSILCLGVVIIILFSPQSSIQKKGGDIHNSLAIIYNENSEKHNVVGTLVRRDKDVGYILTVAGVCITKKDEGSEIKLWLPKMGREWLRGRILKVHTVTEKASDHRQSLDIALIEIQLRGIKNKPVPIYSGEPGQVKGRRAEVWKIDFQTGSVKLYTSGTISAFSTQRTYLVVNAEFQEHIDGAPVVLKSKENKYVLLGILPELLPKTSNPSKYDGGRVDMEETFSFVEIERLIEKVQ